MSMKLSYRDKVIIIVVAVCVVIGVGIFCFIKPRYDDLKVSQSRLAAKQQDEQQVRDKIGTLDTLKKTLEDTVKEITESQTKFVSERDHGETYLVSQYMMEKLSSIVDFHIKGVSLTNLGKMTIGEYSYNKTAVAYPLKINGDIANKLPPEVMYALDGRYPNPPPGVDIAGTNVSIEYGCEDFEQLIAAIQLIADNEENIYLTTCSGQFKSEEELASLAEGEYPFAGTLEITFYEIYPFDPEDINAEPEAPAAE